MFVSTMDDETTGVRGGIGSGVQKSDPTMKATKGRILKHHGFRPLPNPTFGKVQMHARREKAWRSRTLEAKATLAPHPAYRGGIRATRIDTRVASKFFEHMHILRVVCQWKSLLQCAVNICV